MIISVRPSVTQVNIKRPQPRIYYVVVNKSTIEYEMILPMVNMSSMITVCSQYIIHGHYIHFYILHHIICSQTILAIKHIPDGLLL